MSQSGDRTPLIAWLKISGSRLVKRNLQSENWVVIMVLYYYIDTNFYEAGCIYYKFNWRVIYYFHKSVHLHIVIEYLIDILGINVALNKFLEGLFIRLAFLLKNI